jgi:hypothetical protein
MKSGYLPVIVSLFSIILMSCSDNDSTQSDYYKYKGTWLWLKTEGGFIGEVKTPEEGTSLKIILDEFGRYRLFRNDSIKVIANFKIQKTENSYDRISYFDVTSFNYYFTAESNYANRRNDTLMLWDGMDDGYFSFFKKIN